MFADQQPGYHSNTRAQSPPSTHSMSSSFSDSSSTWDSSIIKTPSSTSGLSSHSIKLEDGYLSALYTPERFAGHMQFPQISGMSDGMQDFEHHPMQSSRDMRAQAGQNLMDFGAIPDFDRRLTDMSCHGLSSGAPSLDLDMCSLHSGSGSSPISTDFVIPSQTTFDAFGLQSPMSAVGSMQFDLNYSPASEFAPEYPINSSPASSMAGNMTYYIPTYNGSKSASNTPSKPSHLRQPILDGLPSTAALQRVQSQANSQHLTPDHSNRLTRRKIKREARNCSPSTYGGVHIQKEATQRCMWPGCKGKFQRKEHLRRHEKTHMNMENHQCEFCEKSFNRSDNLKQHVRIHSQPQKKASRTKYFPEALRVYQEMSTKKRRQTILGY